jgi:ATP-dependent HslUV protease ATP-binding subunit HslU
MSTRSLSRHFRDQVGSTPIAWLRRVRIRHAQQLLETTDEAVDAIADIAVEVNSNVENIGARRLQTVMERVLDEISFAAPDRSGETVKIDAAYVREHIGDLAKNADLSRFIL